MAGATLQTIWLIGQFHGVISATTPMGSCVISVVPLLRCQAKVSQVRISSLRCRVPRPACQPCAKARGAPISREMRSAISS